MPGFQQRLKHAFTLLSPQRLGGQTVMALGLKVCNALASFCLSWLIAQKFGAAGTGKFGIAITSMTIISYFVLSGMDTNVVRTVAGDLRQGKKAEARGVVQVAAFGVLVMFVLTAIALWLARAPLTRSAFGSIGVGPELYILLFAVLPLTLQRIASSALRASGRLFASQFIDGPLGTSLAALALIAIIAAGGATSLVTPATLYLAGLFLSATVGWLIYRQTSRDWPQAIRPALLPFAIAGLPVLASNLSNAFTEWYTTVSLGAAWSTMIVGQYRAAWQFVAIAGLVQAAMESILGQRIAGAARVGDPDAIASTARKAFVLLLLLTTPVFIVMLLIPEWLLGLFGPEFVAGAPALRVLVIGQFFRTLGIPLGSILVMTGNQRWILAYALVGIIPCIVLVALLVPGLGAVGAAWATSATIFVRVIGAGLIVNFVLGIKLFKRAK
nr:polysaccharide biosynthesis C-terminal domain-containing protein [Polymorphobacter sp.]